MNDFFKYLGPNIGLECYTAENQDNLSILAENSCKIENKIEQNQLNVAEFPPGIHSLCI